MKLRSPWLIRVCAFLSSWLIRSWMNTIRTRVHFSEGVHHPADPRSQRYIYAFWHETILFPTAFRAKIHALISQHADGELISQVCRFLGFGVVRGSSTRGGGQALVQLMRKSRHTHLGVTPDGPRGPRRRVQPGVIYLASITGLPIVPFGVGYGCAWRARSWDRFAVPMPWSGASAVVAPAVFVPPKVSRAELERYIQLVEEHLHIATEAADRWARGGPRPSATLAWSSAEKLRVSA